MIEILLTAQRAERAQVTGRVLHMGKSVRLPDNGAPHCVQLARPRPGNGPERGWLSLASYFFRQGHGNHAEQAHDVV